MIKDLSLPASGASSGGAPAGAKTPILWALLALAYLFEIGAVAVVINTKGGIQTAAAWTAMGFPLIAMLGISLIRLFGESFFYLSTERLIAVRDATGATLDKELENYNE